MQENQVAGTLRSNNSTTKQLSQIMLGVGSFIFILSIIPVQQGDVVFGSVLDYWLASMNSLNLILLSLSAWQSIATMVQFYWLFALVSLAVGFVLYARKVYKTALVFALLPVFGVFLLMVIEWIGGLRLL